MQRYHVNLDGSARVVAIDRVYACIDDDCIREHVYVITEDEYRRLAPRSDAGTEPQD